MKYFFTLAVLLCSVAAQAQDDAVKWTFSLSDKGNGIVQLEAKAAIERGWHIYATEIPDGIPIPTSMSVTELSGAEKSGGFKAIAKATEKFDPMFEKKVGFYELTATFIQQLKVTDKDKFLLKGNIRAQACNNVQCTPPLPVPFSFSAKDLPE